MSQDESLILKFNVNPTVSAPFDDLFSKKDFFNIHEKKFSTSLFFELTEGKQDKSISSMHFGEIKQGHFRSPCNGSYGGAFFKPLELTIEKLEFFWKRSLAVLKESSHLESIQVVLPPSIYDHRLDSLHTNLLFREGFQLKNVELTYFFENMSAQTFSEKLNSSTRRKYSKQGREGFTSRALNSSEFKEAYSIICANRESQGYPITMTWEDLEIMIDKYQDRYYFFGAFDGDRMAAAAITIKLRPDILYVFYWGEHPDYRRNSPVVTLASSIYNFARERFRILDIGTSTVGSEPNYGLINFKENLGCNVSEKKIFIWNKK